MRTLLAIALIALGSSGLRPADAQAFTQSPLIAGQPVSFAVSGATPNDQAFFLVSTAGLGAGPCLGPLNVCLGVRDPIAILAIVPVDGAGSASFGFVLPAGLPQITVHTQVLLVRGGPAPSAVATNAISAPIGTLALLDDSFDGAALDPRWTILHPTWFTRTVGGGVLELQPTVSGSTVTWYADGEGPFVYKHVTGDFTVSADVHAFDPASPQSPPPANFRMGGITVRDPNAPAGRHNWLHVAVGGGNASVPIAVEDKNTIDSVSSLVLHPITETRGTVRVQRRGTRFSLYYRAPNATTWQLLRAHERPDLPQRLQVGLNVFAWRAPTAVRLRVESIEFRP